MKRNQSGFTLIEIAIVLVIIGLLLGGVLKGQELINSAKVKNLASDFKNVPLFIYGYQDKFRALPGDDIAADTHVSGVVAAVAGSIPGNGVINGLWSDGSTGTMVSGGTSSEAYLFWQHVRLAGLAAGATDITLGDDIRPVNAAGGRIGMQGGSTPSVAGLTGSYIVCSDSVLGKFAKQLDIQMDDGNTGTGSMRTAAQGTVTGGAGGAAVVGAPADETPYTVCMGV